MAGVIGEIDTLLWWEAGLMPDGARRSQRARKHHDGDGSQLGRQIADHVGSCPDKQAVVPARFAERAGRAQMCSMPCNNKIKRCPLSLRPA
ncbi:hypothetical protein D9M70_521620 [compost metagenome]